MNQRKFLAKGGSEIRKVLKLKIVAPENLIRMLAEESSN